MNADELRALDIEIEYEYDGSEVCPRCSGFFPVTEIANRTATINHSEYEWEEVHTCLVCGLVLSCLQYGS